MPGGGRKPLTGIFVTVADSGERKTSVDKLALAAVYRLGRRNGGASTARGCSGT